MPVPARAIWAGDGNIAGEPAAGGPGLSGCPRGPAQGAAEGQRLPHRGDAWADRRGRGGLVCGQAQPWLHP